MTHRLDRARCPECGRELAVQPPAGGDGSADVFPRHYRTPGRTARDHWRTLCGRSRDLVPADAYVQAVDR